MFPLLTSPQVDASPDGARCPKPAGPPRVSDPSPHFRLADLTVHQSDGSGCPGLRVRVCHLPAQVRFITTECSLDRHHFQYRSRADQGPARLSIPSLGITAAHTGRDGLWLVPPGLHVESEWANAAGTVTGFFFAPGFLHGIADQLDLLAPFLGRPSPVLFSTDQRFEALCWLLVAETEDCCLQGPLYFEALARALALSLLHRVRHPKSEAPRPIPGVPPGVRAVIRALEGGFWERRSVRELAGAANLSVGHFTRSFEQATGLTPHRYLLHLRLSRARQLIAQRAPGLSLAEIAATCGFSDQGHLGRHFRRVFGMTPAAFRRAQERPGGPNGKSTGGVALGCHPSRPV
jgi:AraC family transcriptional regulator